MKCYEESQRTIDPRFMVRNADLEAAIKAELERPIQNRDAISAAHLVYADWLSDQRNPLAELIRACVQRRPTDEIVRLLVGHMHLTGQRTIYSNVKAVGPLIDLESKDSSEAKRAARVDVMVASLVENSCWTTGPGMGSESPPAQVFHVGRIKMVLTYGFAREFEIIGSAADDNMVVLRDFLLMPMAAFVSGDDKVMAINKLP